MTEQNHLNKILLDNQQKLQNQINSINMHIQSTQYKDIIEATKKLLNYQYQEGARYTSLIIVVGYAGIFNLLHLIKDYISIFSKITIGALISLSLVSFVVFEIFKMWISRKPLLNFINILNKEKDYEKAFKEYQEEEFKLNTQTSRVWAVSFWLAVISGVLAGVYLVSLFIMSLWI